MTDEVSRDWISSRIDALRGQLADHAEVGAFLDIDLDKPIKSIEDGYPDHTVTLTGKILEGILKQVWIANDISGDPANKQLQDLLHACRDLLRDRTIRDHIVAIQSTRNRAAHHGGQIDEEDALDALRRLAHVLDWFAATQISATHYDQTTKVDPDIRAQVEFAAGLYIVLGYSLIRTTVLAPTIVYQIFRRKIGLRQEYLEIVIADTSINFTEVARELEAGIFQTEYPKSTRMIALGSHLSSNSLLADLDDVSIIRFDDLANQFIDYDNYRRQIIAGSRTNVPPVTASGQVLALDPATHDYSVEPVADVQSELLDNYLARQGNVLVVGKPGAGKTQQLHWLLQNAVHSYRGGVVFFFDLGAKPSGVDLEQYLADSLTEYFRVPRHLVFPLYAYLSRSGRVLNLFDGIDEAAASNSISDFMTVFSAIAELLSAESQIVMTSRTAFLEDSMYIRQLLDRDALAHEKVITEVASAGIDPLKMPRFRVLKLSDLTTTKDCATERCTALEHVMISEADNRDNIIGLPPGQRTAALVSSLYSEILSESDLTPKSLADYFGPAFLEGFEQFSLVELHNRFGRHMFVEELSFDGCLLNPVMSQMHAERVRFRHRVFHEYLAALYLAARPEVPPTRPNITEQIRSFLYEFCTTEARYATDRVVPEGWYIVGPSDNLQIVSNNKRFVVDEYTVNVREYNAFRELAKAGDVLAYQHPMQPDDIDHEPFWERLIVPRYYQDDAYSRFPATAITWWSAFAYARWCGARLPTSAEWEISARGHDARVFPWGDEPDASIANCADYWAGRPLLGYLEWKKEIDSGNVRNSRPMSVDEFPDNISPFGARNMAGNVWEWTATANTEFTHAVICGGSYDNPLRGLRTFSKEAYRTLGQSNVVGFRCVRDILK